LAVFTHLGWKTPRENSADKAVHGTLLLGETHPFAILTERQVIAIRSLARRVSRKEIAQMYGLRRAHVDKLIIRSIWRHI
jgi:hypothetical protein